MPGGVAEERLFARRPGKNFGICVPVIRLRLEREREAVAHTLQKLPSQVTARLSVAVPAIIYVLFMFGIERLDLFTDIP